MIDAIDRLFLERAVELAGRGLCSVAENPRVGCILVRDGQVIGRGWHRRTGDLHAEANAIADAGGDVQGATAYVSLEPCCHTGRQPPCTTALIQGGVTRVVSAMDDPDPRVSGKGYATLRAAGVRVDTTNLAAAQALNQGFVKRITRNMPYVRVKLGASIDGRTAMASGESQWITSAAARADVQYWRARSDAIVTGVGTVLADDPALSVRDQRFASDGELRQPVIAIADSDGRTPASARVFETGEVLLFSASDQRRADGGAGTEAPASAAVAATISPTTLEDAPVGAAHTSRPSPASARVNLHAMMSSLAARGCNEVLVEAGPTLTGALLHAGLWDQAIVYVAPKLLGSTARPMATMQYERLAETLQGAVCDVRQVGDDVRISIEPHRGRP